ncbi:thy-1 membrane glycoprotein-like isoform X2 [Stegostoma tigrinum]|uniref:thy-1 membrane glycoprotein-like isoform X2 n=1 Tax=Stegostoma tigrinum TaxID=3053191 RepID=UPI0028709F1E|nr:thy-1 membrane glycoprotein-like isoform X2 [Stegostoma tigrinum]
MAGLSYTEIAKTDHVFSTFSHNLLNLHNTQKNKEGAVTGSWTDIDWPLKMNQLLIALVLAVLSMTEGLDITNLHACTNKTNDLRLDCSYTTTGSKAVQYEWSLSDGKRTLVVASTIHPEAQAATFKNRVKTILKDTLLRLTLTGFGDSDDGAFTCHLHSDIEPKKDVNKTISVKHGICCQGVTQTLE